MEEKLRPYQEVGVEVLAAKKRLLLADEPGLGKTVQVLKTIQRLARGPVLVLCPKVAMQVWKDEVKKWLGEEVVLYQGTSDQRAALVDKSGGVRFVISTYALAQEIQNNFLSRVTVLVCDEAHRYLRNKDSGIFKTVKGFRSEYLYLLTGTPVTKGPKDLWGYLHLINPREFGSFWGFVNKWCVVFKNEFGLEIGGPKDPVGLKRAINPYMLRRLKKDHLAELPDKQRQAIRIEMTSKQREHYQRMAEDMLTEADNRQLIIAKNSLAKVIRLRQLSISPLLLHINDVGAMLSSLEQQIQIEVDAGNPVVIFTPFVEAIPHIEAAIVPHFGPEKIYRIHGRMTQAGISKSADLFNNGKGPRALIASVQAGISWSAVSADVAYFVGYDWDPTNNWQAEDRLHRLGQKRFVRLYYFISIGTVDEHVMDILNQKTTWIRLCVNPTELLLPKSK